METAGSELREYLATLWQRKSLVVTLTLAVFGLAMFYASGQTPLYISSADVLVRPVTVSLPQMAPQPLIMENEQLIATSSRVANMAQEELGRIALTTITVEIASGAQILQFVAESEDPRAARATANAYARAYLDYRRSGLSEEVAAARLLIERRISALQVEANLLNDQLFRAESPAELTLVQVRLSSITTELTDARENLSKIPPPESITVGDVLEPAGLPTDPVSPDYRRIGVFGLFAGLSLGVGIAFLLDRLQQPLRHRDDLEDAVGAPLLGMIPSWPDVGGIIVVDDPQSPPAEAFRGLRARVAFAMSRYGIRSLMVTSPHPNDGKTTTAINLSAALAEIGQRVVLVLADMRKPPPAHFDAETNGIGLSAVLEGQADLASAVVETDVPNLSVLTNPDPTPHAADLLGSPEMKDLLEALSERADIVVVDTTPVLGPADAMNAAPFTDAVLLVADGKRGTRDEITEAAIELRSVDAKILGVVLTRVSARTFRPYQHRHNYYRVERARRPLPAVSDDLAEGGEAVHESTDHHPSDALVSASSDEGSSARDHPPRRKRRNLGEEIAKLDAAMDRLEAAIEPTEEEGRGRRLADQADAEVAGEHATDAKPTEADLVPGDADGRFHNPDGEPRPASIPADAARQPDDA